jgi:hypothetical protein
MERPHILRSRIAPLGGILVLALAASLGCRSTKSEVPPGRAYARTGEPPVVGFSSEPRSAPTNAASGVDYNYNIGPGASGDDQGARSKSASTFGTPTAGEKASQPTTNAYGPPGTSGVDRSAGATPADLADELMNSGESTAKSLTRDLKVNPPAEQP